MSKTITPSRALRDLADDARILMEATATATGDHVAKARKRLAAALERGKLQGESLMERSGEQVRESAGDLRDLLVHARDRGAEWYGDVRDKTVEKVKAADAVVRDNPYRSIGIALGVGALVGFVASCRHGRNGH
jgi:ElaB/YqjD/DUF883 family membrane-anchored ribosome-binding protein